jgi:hypothetical protein
MADNISMADMQAAIAQDVENLGLQSSDPAVRASAELARTARVGVKAPAPTPGDFSTMSRDQYDASLDANSKWYAAVPGASEALGQSLIEHGLRPDHVQHYGVDADGKVSQQEYDNAKTLKALYLADKGWFQKYQAGDIQAKRQWAGISYVLACGARAT